jgi:nitroreductase
MQPVSRDVVLRQLQWRYATKKFDPARKISPEDWQILADALVLTPSSFGLQPWKFWVITKDEVKQQLLPLSWNQSQVADGSHVVVFAARKNLEAADVDRYLARISEVRGVEVEKLAGFRKTMLGALVPPPSGFDINHWAANQAYIALGSFMTAAALMGIDACPMEGIQPDKYDELLGIHEHGYHTVVACVAGYRAADDKYASVTKVRFPKTDVIVEI